MFERKTDLEAGKSEPDWLREADRLMEQEDAAGEPDVVASVAGGLTATQSLGIIFGGATDTEDDE